MRPLSLCLLIGLYTLAPSSLLSSAQAAESEDWSCTLHHLTNQAASAMISIGEYVQSQKPVQQHQKGQSNAATIAKHLDAARTSYELSKASLNKNACKVQSAAIRNLMNLPADTVCSLIAHHGDSMNDRHMEFDTGRRRQEIKALIDSTQTAYSNYATALDCSFTGNFMQE